MDSPIMKLPYPDKLRKVYYQTEVKLLQIYGQISSLISEKIGNSQTFHNIFSWTENAMKV